MPRVTAPNCPACHAPLRIRPDLAVVKCEYCGREVMVKHTAFQPSEAPPVEPPMLPGQWPQVRVAQVRLPGQRRGAGVAVTAAVLLTVVGVGTASYVSWRARSAVATATDAFTQPGAPGQGAAGEPKVAPEPGNWWSIGSAVHPAQINGDGVEDFLIRFQRSGDPRPLFVIAIDGAIFQRIWTAGPFGEGSDASTYSRVAATAEHVVVTDPAARTHVLTAATGRETATVAMTDRADRVCTQPGGEQAWIDVSDEKHLMVNLATGEARPEKKPPKWCPGDRSIQYMIGCIHYGTDAHRNGLSRARCSDPPRKWKIDGFGRAYALETDSGHVAVGSKDPGTAFPIIVGLDQRGAVRWRRGLADENTPGGGAVAKETPKLVNVAGGSIVVVYKLESDRWRLAALDEATGATRWQRDLAEETHWAAGLTVSDSRVYVLLSSSLAVHDLATGKELAVVNSR